MKQDKHIKVQDPRHQNTSGKRENIMIWCEEQKILDEKNATPSDITSRTPASPAIPQSTS